MEIWKSIEGYKDKYLISNYGNIKSLIDNNKKTREKILKQRIGNTGYMYINLWKNSKVKSKKIHRLVAEAFIPNPHNLPCVNHIDGNKLNNNIENLEWCTQSYNIKHAIENNLTNKELLFKSGKKNIMYGKHGANNINSKKVLQYDLKNNFIKEWENIKEAQKTLNISHISDVCLGKRKTAGGYIWKHKEMLL